MDKEIKRKEVKRDDLIYPDLSYDIIGCAYEVMNKLGGGHPEKVYQKGLAIEFSNKKFSFKEQLYAPIFYDGIVIEKSFLDFFVEEKVVVEIKKYTRFSKSHIDQVNRYLKSTGAKLALLINFSGDDIVFKRLVNITGS